jgi:dTDP-4-dehydrorhamnose 3,5-epimerase
MKIIKTKIKDLVLIKTELFKDKRGFFKEIEKFKVLKKKFIFDCFSYSKKNTLRGLHLQTRKSQAKIITVVHGKILDVVVDLRKKSPNYGKHFSIEISDKSDFSIFIPDRICPWLFMFIKKLCCLL